MTNPPRQRVIFLHPSDELYGADRMLLLMLEAARDRVDVEVWLPNDLDHPDNPLCRELENAGWIVRHEPLPIMRRAYRSPRGLFLLARRAFRLLRDLRSARPDIAYCTTSAAFLGAPVARLARVELVVGHVQEVWSRSDARVLGPAAAACHRLLTISATTRDALPKPLARRATVVLNATSDPGAPTSLQGRGSELNFLVASRWNGWKGHTTLLRAWEAAGHPGRLTILGGPPPSGERVDVPSMVAALGQPESVRVVGEVTDTSGYLDEADVVLVPSDKPEPFGLVVIEAFAHGRPVIASAAGGPLEVITSGHDGWLYEPGDSTDLAKVLTTLDRQLVNAAGRAARATFDDRYQVARWRSEWLTAALQTT